MSARENKIKKNTKKESVNTEKGIVGTFLRKRWKENIISVLIIVAAFFLLKYIAGPSLVASGTSMEDTLHDNDFLLSDRREYKNPKRFDIVEFYPTDEAEHLYIKRVIGLPGEHVRIDEEGNIYINGELLEEDYGKEKILYAGCASGEGITLADDELFCMGDNRNNSLDCRSIGPVKVSRIYGHPYFRIFPFTKIGRI